MTLVKSDVTIPTYLVHNIVIMQSNVKKYGIHNILCTVLHTVYGF